MSSIPCTFEEFKRMAKEFHDSVPTMKLDELDNAMKCLGLGYLGMHEEMWQISASIVLKMMTREYLAREDELLKQQE